MSDGRRANVTAIGRTIVAAALAALSVALAGCDGGSGPGLWSPGPAAPALTPEQRTELQRPVRAVADEPLVMVDSNDPGAGGMAPFDITITTGAASNVHVAESSDGEVRPVELTIRVADAGRGVDTAGELSYTATDVYGRRVAGGSLGEIAVPRNGSAQRRVTLVGVEAPGCYAVTATVRWSGGLVRNRRGFAIVPAPAQAEGMGLWGSTAAQVSAAQSGMRTLWVEEWISNGAGVTNWDERGADRPWRPRFDASALEARLELLQNMGLAVVGRIGRGPAVIAQTPGGLPLDVADFARCTAPLAAMFPTIWRWDIMPDRIERLDATLDQLAAYIEAEAGALHQARPDAEVWATGTPRGVNDYLGALSNMQLVRGVRFVDGAPRADLARWVAAQANIQTWAMTLPAAPGGMTAQRRAWRQVRLSADVLAAGGEVCVPGTAADDPAACAAVGWMSHRLTAARPWGEAWPNLALVRSPVFDVARGAVAVLWSDVGSEGGIAGQPDSGVMVIPDAQGLRAEDCFGQMIGLWRGRALVAPIGEGPIYVVTESGSASDLARRLRAAGVSGLWPVAVRAESFVERVGTGGGATVTVDVAGLVPGESQVALAVDGPEGWTGDSREQTVRVRGGEVKRVDVRFRDAARRPDNQYALTIRVRTEAGQEYARTQIVQEAVAGAMTATVDGQLDEWSDVAAMTMPLGGEAATVSAVGAVQPASAVDPADDATTGRPRAELRFAYDRDYLYVSARVDVTEAIVRNRTVRGTDAAPPEPWGAGTVQVALGRAGSDDSTCVIGLVPTSERAVAVLLSDARGPRRNPVGAQACPGWGEIEGSETAIVDGFADGRQVAVYEAAIPRKALAELDWGAGKVWQVGVLVETARDGSGQWSAAAGVFPWQRSARTFFPIMTERRAATARLGFGRGN